MRYFAFVQVPYFLNDIPHHISMFNINFNTLLPCHEWRNQYQNVWLLALLPPFHHNLKVSSSGEKEYEKQTNKKNIFGTDLIICSDTGGESKAQHWIGLNSKTQKFHFSAELQNITDLTNMSALKSHQRKNCYQ